MLLLMVLSCTQKVPVVLTEGGDGTNKRGNINSSKEYSKPFDLYDGISPEMTRNEVLDNFGAPKHIENIRGKEFYSYSHSTEKSHYYLFILFSEDTVYEFSKDRTRVSEYPNSADFFPVMIEETSKRMSIQDMYEKFESNQKITVAYFDSRSTEPSLELDSHQIEELVNMINAKSDFYYIVGHTHNQGNKKDNLKLSIQRAETIIQLLENNYGLELNKLKATGEGEDNPLYDNDTAVGRRFNSRVEIGMNY